MENKSNIILIFIGLFLIIAALGAFTDFGSVYVPGDNYKFNVITDIEDVLVDKGEDIEVRVQELLYLTEGLDHVFVMTDTFFFIDGKYVDSQGGVKILNAGTSGKDNLLRDEIKSFSTTNLEPGRHVLQVRMLTQPLDGTRDNENDLKYRQDECRVALRPYEELTLRSFTQKANVCTSYSGRAGITAVDNVQFVVGQPNWFDRIMLWFQSLFK